MFFRIFLFVLFGTMNMYAQLIVSSNEVENVYTQAVDARFSGDLAKSRNLLENLKENNFTNEYAMNLLVEVYVDYLKDIIKNRDFNTLKVAYPGIRKNIAEIWDLFPKSETIQNNALQAAWLTSDRQFGLLMTEVILSDDPFNFIANYYAGMYLFTQKTYVDSIPYFKRVAYASIESGKEQYIFQARINLGDIFLEQKSDLEALKYYYKALELASTPELIAKLAVLETYRLNYSVALDFFSSIPVYLMTPELFDGYMAALWREGSASSKFRMNTLLSTSKFNTLFSKSLIQMQLGRSQKALSILEKENFIKNNLPAVYFSQILTLNERLGIKKDLFSTKLELGQFFYKINRYQDAENMIRELALDDDKTGQLAYLLAKLSRYNLKFKEAREFYYQSLQKQKTLELYTELIEIEMGLSNIKSVEDLIKQASNELTVEELWTQFMEVYLMLGRKEYSIVEEKISELIKNYPNISLFNNTLALVYFELEKYEELGKLLEILYQTDPSDISVKNYLAYYYSLVNKELDKALMLISEVVEEKPYDIVYLDTLAWVYVKRSEWDKAQGVFDQIEDKLQAVPLIQGFEELYAHLGYFYKKTGNSEKSEFYFSQALKIDKENQYINDLYNE